MNSFRKIRLWTPFHTQVIYHHDSYWIIGIRLAKHLLTHQAFGTNFHWVSANEAHLLDYSIGMRVQLVASHKIALNRSYLPKFISDSTAAFRVGCFLVSVLIFEIPVRIDDFLWHKVEEMWNIDDETERQDASNCNVCSCWCAMPSCLQFRAKGIDR